MSPTRWLAGGERETTMDATLTAEEHYLRGRELLRNEDAAGAFEHFRASYGLKRDCARYASYYGLCLAIVERRFNKGLELCRGAARDEFFNPELYLNLARVHLAFGFKAEALRLLRRGLMIDPAHAEIREELESLGRRQPPVLAFLPRGHLLNRMLGRARNRLHASDIGSVGSERLA